MRRPIRAALAGMVAVVSVLTWTVSPAEADIPDDWPYPEDLETTEPTEQGPGNPGEQTTAVRYGPYRGEAAPTNPDGTHGHWHSGNRFAFGIQKPCNNCYITSMKAELLRSDGSVAGHSNNLQLHHMVLFNSDAGRTDATCPFPLGLFGQRFFASGDERTLIQFPKGTGYYTGTGGWNLIWELASTSTAPENVFYQVTYTWVPGSANMSDIEPIWFDVDQCGDSQINIPAGSSQQSWTWNVNRPGYLVGIGGHLHDYGTNIEIRNQSTGELLCDSIAGYGGDPLYIGHHGERHISMMTTCGGQVEWDPVTTLTNGQRVSITSHYAAVPEPTNDAMGIVMGFMAEEPPPDQGGGGNGDCIEATNDQHRTAGRAEGFLILTAVGSGQSLGLWYQTTSLRERSPGVWERC